MRKISGSFIKNDGGTQVVTHKDAEGGFVSKESWGGLINSIGSGVCSL